MSLQGVLSDFGVADIFQLVAQQRKKGVLSVEHAGRTLEVHFVDGAVLRARPAETRPDGALASFLLRTGALAESALDEVFKQQEETLESLPRLLRSLGALEQDDIDAIVQLTTNETIFELFLWDEGSFRFLPTDVERTISDRPVSAEMVLLDSLRMRDEWAAIQSRLPDLSVVMAQCVDIEGFRGVRAAAESTSGMSADDLDRLFNLCNGRASARRVIDLSRLGTFNGARGLVALVVENGLTVERRKETADAATRARARPRPLLGYAILALCALLAGGLFQVPAAQHEDYPMPLSSLSQARAAAATERVRMALEARRWAEGAYPESLEDLAAEASRLLATVPLDRYSYARAGDGYRLSRSLP